MIKRYVSLILIMVLLLSCIVSVKADIMSYDQQFIVNSLSSDSMLQLNDGGIAIKKIINELINKGYLKKGYTSPTYSAEIEQAVIKFQRDNDLISTGMMDNETLTLLLHNRKETYMPIYVFIPTDGGKKYHGNPNCSDMAFPRIVSLENARELGFTQCHSSVYSCKSIFDSFNIYDDDIDETNIGSYLDDFIKRVEKYLKDRDISNTETIGQEFVIDENVKTEDINRSSPSTQYIGNKNSHVFHNPSCNSAKSMKESNKIVFDSREEAVERGYKPCSRCNP